jgi:HAD superfamily hydrolase (TIGR01509 family)
VTHTVPKLVIFDCDGVLVDSEPISIGIMIDIITAAGVTISEEQAYRLFLGRSIAAVNEILLSEFGLVVTGEHLERARAELQARFHSDLKPMPGIAETLKALDMRVCVASSSHPDRIRLSLSLTGLLEMLEPHIYSASMVARGKPAPDLFLHAARDMGVDPTDCVVIEDSPAGIDAAHAAGMRVFAFTGGSHAGNAALVAELATRSPDRIFADMRLLPDLLADSGKRAL